MSTVRADTAADWLQIMFEVEAEMKKRLASIRDFTPEYAAAHQTLDKLSWMRQQFTIIAVKDVAIETIDAVLVQQKSARRQVKEPV